MQLQSRPRVALVRSSGALVAGILVLVLCGCSAERLPLAPERNAIHAQAATSAAAGGKYEVVVVTVVADEDADGLAADYGATLVGHGWRVAGLRPAQGHTADELLTRVSTDRRAVTVELDMTVETAEARQKSWAFDDGTGSPEMCVDQLAASACGAQIAHESSLGDGVPVAVLDTGVDPAHPWLQSRVADGWDFVDDDAQPDDVADGLDDDGDGCTDEAAGHGTHVAGVVALAAPGARLLIGRVLDSDGRGDMLAVARGVRWAVAHGARVINMSLGGLEKSDAVAAALDEAADAGVVVVAAAGNWGASVPVEFPAGYRHVVAVAAIDSANLLAPFSSYGGFVALCAPGVAIRSSYLGGRYALWSGTSMAAPWVSGGAALLLAEHPDWARGQVVDRLAATARRIWKENPTHRQDVGAGALDLAAAVAPLVVTGSGEELSQ